MKTKLMLSILAAALWIATNVALAHHGNKGNNGNHRGWERLGHPHHYASPKHPDHP